MTEALGRARSADVVYRAALYALKRLLSLTRASVLTFDESGIARFRAWAGLSPEYRRAVDGHCPWKPGEKGAQPILTPDVRADSDLSSYLPVFEREGIRALAFIPLLGGEGVLGKFMLYYDEPHVFAQTEVQLAVMVAGQVAYAAERVRSAEERRRQTERLAEQAALLDLADDGIMALTMDGVIEFWNRGAERMYGWKASEALGKNCHELLSTRSPGPLASLKEKLLRHGSWEGELTHRTKNGVERIVSSRWALRTDARGGPRGILEITRDITEQKRGERALAESEERLSLAIRSTQIGTFDIFPQARKLIWSDFAKRHFGLASEKPVSAKTVLRAIHRDDRAAVLELARDALGGRVAGEFSIEFRTLGIEDGRERWISASGRIFAGGTDSPLRVIGVILDLTARKAAEKRIEDVLDSIRESFIAIDRDWRFTYVNGRVADALGRPREQIVGHRLFEFAPEYESSAFSVNYRRVMEERIPVQFEVPSVDGSRWWEVHAYPTDEGLSAYIMDITARVAAERVQEKLRESAKLESLGVLAGGIAHDFNNLLTGILGGASLIRAEIPDDSPLRESAETIMQASERAADLTRQMLAYSGRGQFVIEPLDLSAQVSEIVRLLHASISKDVELALELRPGLPAIQADAGQLQQLVMNLVINAAEAIQGYGLVSVRTGTRRLEAPLAVQSGELPTGDYVFLEVRDTGVGMDHATIGKIFDPFFTTKFTGRGLGLAAALGILRGHKGGISVSSARGCGSAFTAYFPAAGTVAAIPESFHPEEGRNRTILVIDDEELVWRTAQAALETRGYRVLTAPNGKAGIEIFAAAPEAVDLVLLDMTMPVMGGAEAFRILRDLRPGLCVLASSGYSEEEAQRRFGAGLSGFIQKPYSVQALRAKVAAALGAVGRERNEPAERGSPAAGSF